MTDDSHRGAEDTGPFSSRGDARVDRITDLLLEQEGQSPLRPARDAQRALQLLKQQASRSIPLAVGVVVHAVPHFNWYKVQMGDGSGWLGCCRLSDANCIPLGPRTGNAIASGSRVLVWRQPNATFGVIAGVLPHRLEDPRVASPSWLAQGAATGVKREAAHRQLFKGMSRQGGVEDFSCNSPIDATSMDLAWLTELGLAMHLSPFEIAVRVNEMCGLFLNYFDSQAVLAGWNMEHVSASHQLAAGHDEGECRFKEEVAIFPWEAAGLYGPSGDIAEEREDVEVHYEGHKGKVDLPDGGEDAVPAYRSQRYAGYEGQGGLRTVMRPGETSGRRSRSDGVVDHGLFLESIGADGSYLLQSAKSVIIAKRLKVAQPREIVQAESAEGDDAAAGGYRASSQFGDGPEHRVGDIAGDDAIPVASIQDVLAHACNWKAVHPFHYRSDYALPQQGEMFGDRISENLDYSALGDGSYLSGPTPVRLGIDHRYGEVSYYARESFLAFLDDGSVVLGGGAGEGLTFHGGRVRIDSPAGLELACGGDILLQGAGIVLKAQDSVDVSSSRKDVRLWANENLQAGAGSCLLLESKGASDQLLFKDRVGEDVRGGGVVIKSAGAAAIVAGDVYCRSTSGDVVLDAAALDGRVLVVAAGLDAVLGGDLSVHHVSGIDGSTLASHRLGRTSSSIAGSLSVGGQVLAGDGLVVAGNVSATGDIGAGGRVADSEGQTVSRVPDSFKDEADQTAQSAAEAAAAIVAEGDGILQDDLADGWHAENRPGNDETIGDIGFSYRDSDDPGKQYGTSELAFLEPRWTTLARLGGASGGEAWVENPVSYQGRQLYPWPGREQWLGPTVLRAGSLTMHDAAAGLDLDRPGPYEDARFGGTETASMAESTRVVPHR